MTTHEMEITEEVDLCSADGVHLNPAAKGWSRSILHRANLIGRWGRTKRWDYWAIQSEAFVIAVTVADIDYLGLVAVDWLQPKTHRTGGRSTIVPFGRGVELPDEAATGRLDYSGRNLAVSIDYANDATELAAQWTEHDGNRGSLAATVAAPAGHESLNVVIPWSETRFQFTSKRQALPAGGTVTLGDHTFEVGGAPGEAWGILDIGRGRWPYQTRWNWGGGAGHAISGELVGLQIGGKWTDHTGFTENGVFIDGRLVKIGEDLEWLYDWDRPLEPWRVRSEDRSLDMTLAPVHDRHANTNLGVLTNEVHQVFGHWTGRVPGGAGSGLRVDGILGFAEEARARW